MKRAVSYVSIVFIALSNIALGEIENNKKYSYTSEDVPSLIVDDITENFDSTVYTNTGEYDLGVKDFIRDTAIDYTFVWAARFFYVRNKNSKIFDVSLSNWWDNITTFPEWPDGDSFTTNWIVHPTVGSQQYLYYRAMGYSFWASTAGSFVQSVLWEYTVEGLSQPPSLEDLVSTTGVGVPLGVVLENSSDWLISRDFIPAKVLGHILNPMRNFVQDRQIGVYNPFSETFMTITGPIDFKPSEQKAIDLSYSMFLESPLPLGRFMTDIEVVSLKDDLSGEFIFYTVRIDIPSANNFWGVYVALSQSGQNALVIDGERNKDGFEFANLLVGGKFLLYKTHNSVVSGGMDLILPTSYKDNLGRLQNILLYRKNFPTNIQSAYTLAPYISAAAWKGVFNVQGMVGSDWVLNAGKLEGNDMEFRIKYGTAAGVNIPAPTSPALFAEFNGYSLLTAGETEKTQLFIAAGIRFGRKYSPGFVFQVPLFGPEEEISSMSLGFDFQVRL